MKKLSLALLTTLFISSQAVADYTMVIPQKPGGGTSQWASIIAKYLEPHLGEKIKLVHIPGARDIPGFNKFHNELRFDEKTIMVSHGGNGVSYLTEEVDYNYKEYQPIGGMNLTIIIGEKDLGDHIYFSGGSGNIPDVMALTLYMCGNLSSFDAYEKCYKESITFVKGMSGSERRLAFNNGELNITRENPAAYKKHAKAATLLFTHGVFDLNEGKVVDDRNHPRMSFDNVFTAKWGEAPKGDFYDAYMLVKNYRDMLQKALWMNKNNSNAKKVTQALIAMLKDEEAVSAINKKVGDYDWFIADELLEAVNYLETNKNDDVKSYLIKWQREVLGYNAVDK
jgi:hypothetical protein